MAWRPRATSTRRVGTWSPPCEHRATTFCPDRSRSGGGARRDTARQHRRAAIETSGPIDVLVNNAGVGLFGAFEATPMATVREVFETNTFGVMAMTQAVLPQLRARKSGVVVNVTSSAALAPMPLVAVYTASKMAIEAFTASLALELEAFDVRVKLVEPGYGPTTRFARSTGPRMEGLIPEAYAPLAERTLASMAHGPAAVTSESDVAGVVWRAANDASGQLRFPAGPDAVALARSR
jgi:short-subunit dehydrogenase